LYIHSPRSKQSKFSYYRQQTENLSAPVRGPWAVFISIVTIVRCRNWHSDKHRERQRGRGGWERMAAEVGVRLVFGRGRGRRDGWFVLVSVRGWRLYRIQTNQSSTAGRKGRTHHDLVPPRPNNDDGEGGNDDVACITVVSTGHTRGIRRRKGRMHEGV
jgi:hypothetical protein